MITRTFPSKQRTPCRIPSLYFPRVMLHTEDHVLRHLPCTRQKQGSGRPGATRLPEERKEFLMKHELTVLAAWLRHIGRFAQWAGAPASKRPERESRRYDAYTDAFIQHVLPLPPEMDGLRGTLARMASARHLPETASREEKALQEADRLASGGDRVDGDTGANAPSARLDSVFHTIRLEGKGSDSRATPPRYRLLPLDDGDSPIFPCAETDGKETYARLYADFCQALTRIPLNLGFRHYLHSLATVLERFTWCVPSLANGNTGSSLHDHASATAAIAQVLLDCPEGREGFLLFGADLNGIQSFIFGDESHADGGDAGAAKLLRARSFLLQALTRSVWLALLDRLELSHAARIMDAGGRFVLLLPDTDATRAELHTLEQRVERWLLEEFQGAIRMTFTRLPLKPEDLLRQRFVERFETFNDMLERAKLRPFAGLFQKGLSPVLPTDHAAYREFGECALCRVRPASAPETSQDAENDHPMCPQCRHLVRQIGRRLPQARYLVFDRRSGGLPLYGGLRLRLEEKTPRTGDALDIVSIRDREAFSAVPVAGFIPTVRPEDLERWEQEGRLRREGDTILFAGEECREGEPKTFAMLAEEARVAPQKEEGAWRSVPYLAACKADVDNLGLIFGMGFGTGKDSRFSLARFAMLSRMMNNFFGAHLMRVIEKDFPNIYVIFAGGDDLFVLGPWSDVIAFAQRLHKDFTAFAGGNPAVSLSAGLPAVKPRLPIRALREAAEQALEQSKDHPGKNAVTLFGVTAPWEQCRSLLEDGKRLEDLCLRGVVTQGLVRRLLGYARDCRDFASGGDIRKGLYLSHMAYDLARNFKATDEIQWLQRMGQNRTDFPKAELGITWALYRTRLF